MFEICQHPQWLEHVYCRQGSGMSALSVHTHEHTVTQVMRAYLHSNSAA
jgi:hypothetical protein